MIYTNNPNKAKMPRIKKIKKIKRKKIMPHELINNLVLLPFCEVILTECCNAMKKNRGLYTQCKKLKHKGSDYCLNCIESARNHSTGKPPYGDIRERNNLKEDNMLSGLVSYVDVMEKLDITRYEAERDAERLGWKIPDCEWTTLKKKRGRPKKKKKIKITPYVEDSDDEQPKAKEKTKARNVSDEDLLNMFLARSQSI
jgi:hypothetical protein